MLQVLKVVMLCVALQSQRLHFACRGVLFFLQLPNLLPCFELGVRGSLDLQMELLSAHGQNLRVLLCGVAGALQLELVLFRLGQLRLQKVKLVVLFVICLCDQRRDVIQPFFHLHRAVT